MPDLEMRLKFPYQEKSIRQNSGLDKENLQTKNSFPNLNKTETKTSSNNHNRNGKYYYFKYSIFIIVI